MNRVDRSLDLVLRLNKFADDCEAAIRIMSSRYRQAKADAESRCAAQTEAIAAWQKRAVQTLNGKCARITTGVSDLLRSLEKLEIVIARTDKYYQKTKAKAAASTELPALNTSDDYLTALQQIVERFQAVSEKYTQRVLPFLINDVNYLLSKRRKQDYSELLALQRLALRLKEEATGNLKEVRDEELSAIEARANRENAAARQKLADELAAIQASYEQSVEQAADVMCQKLEEIVPDDEIDSLRAAKMRALAQLERVNTRAGAFPEKLMLYTYVFPIREYVSLPMLQQLLASKCAPLIVQDDTLVLPAEYDLAAPVNVMIQEEKRTDMALKSMQQTICTYLSAIPVARLKLAVVDPEHHGNSIAPFFELQRVEPELLYQNIAVTQEEIAKLIAGLSDYVDETLRYRLSGESDTVFDTPEDAECILLLIFDHPSHFSEDALSLLRNILRNGYRCGIHVMILSSHTTAENISAERRTLLAQIEELATRIVSQQGMLVSNGLECLYPLLPEGKALSGHLDRYLLTCSSVKSEGFTFHSTIKDLIVADSEEQASAAISLLRDLADRSEKTWCRIADDPAYPEHIVLGGAYYPFSVFAERPAERLLRSYCRIEARKGAEVGLKQEYAFLPYCISTRDGFNLYLEHADKDARGAQGVIHHIMWRLLSSFPVSKVKFTVISCERSLNAISPFIELQKALPDVFDEGVCVSPDAITARLQRLNQFIDDVLQNKLSHKYENMVDYNIATPNRAEAMNVLAIFDYPKGFDAHKNELLGNIIRNGRKCGVFTIICHNADLQYSRYDTLDEHIAMMKKNGIATLFKANNLYLQPYGLELDFSQRPSADEASAYTAEYAAAYAQLQRKGLDFKEIVDPRPFGRDSARGLEIPIGLGDGDSVVNVRFGVGSSHHALIAGATGSGKSTLLHTLIMSSMVHYAPSQLHLYLLDFKSGTEFKVYERARLPHMKLLALDAMQEFGESILEDLVEEMVRRSDAFKQYGCSKVEEYVEKTGSELPRILVIMDEFQILYNDMTNRRVANNCAELTKRLVTEGRAFGIHLVMATQSTKVIGGLALEAGTVEQMRIRIGMKCGESDARYLFGDRNDMKALQMMKGPIGTAVMNLEYTEDENIGLRVAYCGKEAMSAYQEAIEKEFASSAYTLQIFEGSRTVAYLDFIREHDRAPYESATTEIDMGIMIKVAPPFTLSVDRRKRHNLLICGANERMTENIVTVVQLGILRNRAAGIVDINGEWLVSENYEGSPSEELSAAVSRYKCCRTRAEIVATIRELHEEYLRRKAGSDAQPLFICIRDLQYLDIIQQMLKGERVMEADYLSAGVSGAADSGPFNFGQSFGMGGDSATEKLLAMINDGVGYGIYFLVTCAEQQVVKECMQYGENTLPKFPERIIFSLGDADADRLIEGVSVSRMRENTVYFSDGVKKAFQYKPFTAPDRDALMAYVKTLL